jgi:hypothetical protein
VPTVLVEEQFSYRIARNPNKWRAAMVSISDVQQATIILGKKLQASVAIHVVKHPNDNQFEKLAPCFRVTVTAIDPDSGQQVGQPQWRDISATATPDECTFVVKVEKLANIVVRIFKKPKRLQLKIKGEPLPAWREKYDSLEQTETVGAGVQTTLRLAFVPRPEPSAAEPPDSKSSAPKSPFHI